MPPICIQRDYQVGTSLLGNAAEARQVRCPRARGWAGLSGQRQAECTRGALRVPGHPTHPVMQQEDIEIHPA
jgi:hypothetical protein